MTLTMNKVGALSLAFAFALSTFGCAATTAESDAAVGVDESDLTKGQSAFDALEDHDKLDVLYKDFDGDAWGLDLQDGFTQTSVTPGKLPSTIAGPARAELWDKREYADREGGEANLFAIKKGRWIYGYVIEAAGRSWGNWASTDVYDRKFNWIGSFGNAD